MDAHQDNISKEKWEGKEFRDSFPSQRDVIKREETDKKKKKKSHSISRLNDRIVKIINLIILYVVIFQIILTFLKDDLLLYVLSHAFFVTDW